MPDIYDLDTDPSIDDSDQPATGPDGTAFGSGAIISAGIGAIGSAVGTAIQTNQSKDESAKNRKFQKKMSNTAYRRAVKDMRKAGINPMLAYIQGGASTPSGSMADIPDMTKPVTAGIQAMQAKATTGLLHQQAATGRQQERDYRESANRKQYDNVKAKLEADIITYGRNTAEKRNFASPEFRKAAGVNVWENLKATLRQGASRATKYLQRHNK